MFKLGREVHVLAALNWRDVFDNLHRFAQGINEINRDSLKPDTVTNQMLAPKTLYKIFGFFDDRLKQPIPKANPHANHWMDRLNSSRVLVRSLELDDDEFGSYMLSWRINFTTDDGDFYPSFLSVSNPFYAEASVDGIRLGGPMGCDDFTPCGFNKPGYTAPEYNNDTHDPEDRADTDEFILSGFSSMNLLGGLHVVAIDLFSMENITINNIDASITRMNW